MKLSLILPCYNVERYVRDCLDSIYVQDYPESDFEVICVNDSSTDNTLSIISEFEKKHSNLRIINHSYNRTLGGARNTGLENARGEYLWFIDPDDLIRPGCLHELLESVEQRPADIVLFNYEVVDKDNRHIRSNQLFDDSDLLDGQTFIEKYTNDAIYVHCIVWRCLFRNEFIRKNGLMFPVMRKGADDAFQLRAMLLAVRVYSVKKEFYLYRSNPYSVSRKTHKAQVVFADRIVNAYQYHIMLRDLPDIREGIRGKIVEMIRWFVNSTPSVLRKLSFNERHLYYDAIRDNRSEIKELYQYMNRKCRALFSTKDGRYLWSIKVIALLWIEHIHRR